MLANNRGISGVPCHVLALVVGFSIPVLVAACWCSSTAVGGTSVTCMALRVGYWKSSLSALLFLVLESRLDGPPPAPEHVDPLSLFPFGFPRGISNA